ncbi:XRE family transcriptional regulator [Candidatus Saganbacteria bacterium CG08_land_8_20_14_0_20_45_16]|uniref:XRE family transcriptional regulator n=1 Tax=Candidatus Saganbacteria bacterium CG08_land_8_20_14_0_20_45_16 TaxID=2014293 RepID=A0A2H0Y214_UNCSA|nr:MAG: XRE family transcriptional regulator [Candidatus Saganbacteria bacterium CG08_land_8_20_14_0_20_45_16]
MKALSFPSPNKKLLSSLGNEIKALRKKDKLTIEAFADKCGLHPKYIQTIEHGKRNVSISVFLKLAESLGVTPPNLLKKS